MNPQLTYMVLFLPAIFGLVALGQGIAKAINQDEDWLLNAAVGLILLTLAFFVGVFFL